MKKIIPFHRSTKHITLRQALLALLLATSATVAHADDLTVDNTRRNYIVYAPKNLGKNRPLLISCHGMNQDAGYQQGMLQIESIADTAKFVTVFPNGIDRGWDISGDRDIRFVLALIDEMEARYAIDRNRVYLSGFSMGGMFTYHAMNRIADKIAAFAPISGYPMWGGNFTSSRPVPIIHTHGTSDDVVNFGGVASTLAGWVKRNGCPAKDRIEKPYRANHITRHTWGPGENGVEVVLMELAGKGHWISNDIVKSGEEIWNFCKRYSLEMKDPTVRITAPTDGLQYISFGGPSDVPPLAVKATATSPVGTIANVAFYDGDQLLAETTEPPYSYTLDHLAKGTHEIRAVATDNEGRTGESQITIAVEEPTGNYVFSRFDSEGCVPDGWTTYDGQERRTGFATGFSSGSRVFHFTGDKHDFDYGLYTRNVTGQHNAGYARFAEKGTSTTLTLHPGNYQVFARMANWNQPGFSPVTIAVEDSKGQAVYAETFTPTANVGNSAANSFDGVTMNTMTFDIDQTDRYVVTFYTADAAWADLVVGRAAIRRKGDAAAIRPAATDGKATHRFYNLQGQPTRPSAHGLYIMQTVAPDGQRHSRVVAR